MKDMFKKFSDQLNKCECCPRECKANRLEGQTGFCGIGAGIEISHAVLHFGEESPVSGTRGSGTVFFAGCNLRCVFCQNYQISQELKAGSIRSLSIDELAYEMLQLQDKGAHNINFVSPSHMIFLMADAINEARKKGLTIPIVYNSNGYDSVDALRQIRGLVDIYLPDIKYMENELGKRFSYVEDYADIIPDVIKEMLDQVGHLKMNDEGIAERGLLVRHLVLPGYPENSRKCLRFLADLSPDIFISIMSQYSPQYNACNYPEINRILTKEEYDDIIEYAILLGLENAYIQETESQEHYLPDFSKEKPFNTAL